MLQTSTLRPDQVRALERLYNRRTLYEIEIVRLRDGARGLLCYSDSTSQVTIRGCICKRAIGVLAFFGAGRSGSWQAAQGVTFQWDKVARRFALYDAAGTVVGHVQKTGRTKRDVIMEDRALPFVGTVGYSE